MREWLARLRDWLRRDELDRELTEELRFTGNSWSETPGRGRRAGRARDAARRRLGNVTRRHEEARDRWSWPWLDHFQKDLRYAFRGLRRSPGFTATVIAHPRPRHRRQRRHVRGGRPADVPPVSLPARSRSTVHRVYLTRHGPRAHGTTSSFEYTRYLDLTKFTTSFLSSPASRPAAMAVGVGDAVARTAGRRRSARRSSISSTCARRWADSSSPPKIRRRGRQRGGAGLRILAVGVRRAGRAGRDAPRPQHSLRDHRRRAEGFRRRRGGEPPAVFIPITTSAGERAHRADGHHLLHDL